MRPWLVVAAVVSAVVAAAGQSAVRDQTPFKGSVELVTIAATVTDAEGHLVRGLPREAFEAFEDGEKQTITQFTNERVPLGLGLLLDASDSMFGTRIRDARIAVDRFLFDLLDSSDEFFVSTFNHKPRTLTTWGRDRALVQRVLAAIQPSGGTAIYDAVLSALPVMTSRTKQRAAILVISDGADTASDGTLRDVRGALWRSDAFVYAIAIDPPEKQAINTRVNVQALREVTTESGGHTEVVQSTADLEEATARIAEELNSQYVLGYSSSHPGDGRFHSIRLRAGSYRVRARNGYVR